MCLEGDFLNLALLLLDGTRKDCGKLTVVEIFVACGVSDDKLWEDVFCLLGEETKGICSPCAVLAVPSKSDGAKGMVVT